MRDPARIPLILAELQKAWERNPDMRLGQLLVCIHAYSASKTDIFNTEDDKILVSIYNWIEGKAP